MVPGDCTYVAMAYRFTINSLFEIPRTLGAQVDLLDRRDRWFSAVAPSCGTDTPKAARALASLSLDEQIAGLAIPKAAGVGEKWTAACLARCVFVPDVAWALFFEAGALPVLITGNATLLTVGFGVPADFAPLCPFAALDSGCNRCGWALFAVLAQIGATGGATTSILYELYLAADDARLD